MYSSVRETPKIYFIFLGTDTYCLYFLVQMIHLLYLSWYWYILFYILFYISWYRYIFFAFFGTDAFFFFHGKLKMRVFRQSQVIAFILHTFKCSYVLMSWKRTYTHKRTHTQTNKRTFSLSHTHTHIRVFRQSQDLPRLCWGLCVWGREGEREEKKEREREGERVKKRQRERERKKRERKSARETKREGNKRLAREKEREKRALVCVCVYL